MKDVRYQKWVWPSIDSVDPSHRAFQVWCFSHVWFWNYSLSKVKFRHSYVRISFMYYWTPLHIASLRQLSASLRQHQEAPWPYCYTPDSRCHSCAGHWEVSLNVNQVSSSLIRQWISPYFKCGRLQPLSRATMQYSVECAGPQKHNGASPVFIHCMVLEIQLFFLILSIMFRRSIAFSGRHSE